MKTTVLLLALAALAAGADGTGALEVRVFRGSTKTPAAGAVVTLAAGGGSEFDYQKTTNAVGRVRFERVPIGVYDLNVFLAGHVHLGVRGSLESVVIRAGESASRELQLHRKPVITGQVSDPEGRPLPQANVRLLKQTHARRGSPVEEAESAVTDDRGVYRFALEEPGRYWVLGSRFEREYRYGGSSPVRYAFSPDAPDLAGAQPADAAFNQPEVRRDVILPWAAAAGLTARVRSGRTGQTGQTGQDCPRCSYVLLRMEGDASYPVHNGYVRPHEPPRSHSVRVPGLPPGRYRLEVRDSRSFDDYWSASGALTLPARGTYDLTTSPPARVAGHIEFEGPDLPAQTQSRRRPRRMPYLSLKAAPDGRKLPPYFGQGAQVTDDRSFRIRPTPAATYELVAHVRGYGYISAVERNGRPLPNSVLRLDDGGDWSNLKVTISRETAEFRPTLSGIKDAPPRSYRVMLTPLEDDFTQPASGYCGSGGQCAVDNIAPGRYAVLAVPETGDRSRLGRMRRDPQLAPWTHEVELHAGPNPEITLTPVPDDVLSKL